MKALLRIAGAVLCLGGLLFALGYSWMVQNSGTVVASADIKTSEEHPLDEVFSGTNLREYQYYKFEFMPIEIAPGMGDLKLSLESWGTNLRPSRQAMIAAHRGDQLKMPYFILKDEATSQMVWEKHSVKQDAKILVWGFEIPYVDYGFSSEGKADARNYNTIGHIDVPQGGRFILTVDNIILRKNFLSSLQQSRVASGFRFNLISGSMDMDIAKIIYASISVMVGAFLLFLTKPQGQRRRHI